MKKHVEMLLFFNNSYGEILSKAAERITRRVFFFLKRKIHFLNRIDHTQYQFVVIYGQSSAQAFIFSF